MNPYLTSTITLYILGGIVTYRLAVVNGTMRKNWERILIPTIWPLIAIVGGLSEIVEWLQE